MRSALALACIAALSACSDVPQSRGPAGAPGAWGYKPGERAPSVISESEFEQLSMQVMDLKAQRATLAGIVRTSPDPAVRAKHQASIADLSGRIDMLVYRLRAAGRPVPAG